MKVSRNGTDRLVSENETLKKRIGELEAELAERAAGQKAGDELKSWLDSLLDMLPAFVYLQSPDYTVPYANKYFIDHFGRPEGKLCYELLRGRDGPCDYCPSLSVLQTGEPLVWEWTETVDGRAYLVYDYPFHGLDGSPVVLELGIDITERKAMLDELKKFKFILDGAGEELFLVDRDGRIHYVNDAAAGSLGYARERLNGMRVTDIAKDLTLDGWREEFDLLRAGDVPAFERVHVDSSGREIPKEVKSVYLNISDHEYICAFARDISERKRAEQERTEFLAMVSHDIRSPMTTIIGIAELLAEESKGKLDRESLEMLGDISRSGRKVTDMLKDFVTVARLEIGKLPINYFPAKPYVIVEECLLDFAQKSAEKPVELSSQTEEGLELVTLDKDLVERALGNLINNAIDYTPAGGHVSVGASARMVDGVRMLELSVKDDGPGIPPGEHELAFQKYARLKTSTGVKGTGLGLPIVKAVAEAHGGRVELVSDEGKGARFAILLPYRKNEIPEAR